MWFAFALLCAFCMATANVLTKAILIKDADEYFVGWLKLLFALPILLVFLFFNPSSADATFYKVIAIILPLEVCAYVLFLKALKISPMSTTLPFLALTPVFSIFIGFFLLGETLTSIGIVGILCVVIGAYVLNADVVKSSGLLEPFRQAVREKGSKFIIVVAFIYAFTSAAGKVAILHSSPSYFAAVYFLILTLAWLPLLAARTFYLGKKKKRGLFKNISGKRNLVMFLCMGLLFGMGIIFHCLAIARANVAYMIAIKRSGVVFSVIYGGLFFKEKNIHVKLAGVCLMFVGVFLIALA